MYVFYNVSRVRNANIALASFHTYRRNIFIFPFSFDDIKVYLLQLRWPRDGETYKGQYIFGGSQTFASIRAFTLGFLIAWRKAVAFVAQCAGFSISVAAFCFTWYVSAVSSLQRFGASCRDVWESCSSLYCRVSKLLFRIRYCLTTLQNLLPLWAYGNIIVCVLVAVPLSKV